MSRAKDWSVRLGVGLILAAACFAAGTAWAHEGRLVRLETQFQYIRESLERLEKTLDKVTADGYDSRGRR